MVTALIFIIASWMPVLVSHSHGQPGWVQALLYLVAAVAQGEIGKRIDYGRRR